MILHFNIQPYKSLTRVLAVLICTGTWVNGQPGGGLSVTANLKIEEGNFDLSSVLLENKTTSEKHSVKGTAKLTFKLKFNSTYVLSFSKPGYITKKIEINTSAPAARISQGFYPIHFNVFLMPQYEGINVVVFNQPVSKWQFHKQMDEFFYDTDYTKSIQSAIKDAEDELARKRDEEKEKASQAKKEALQAKKDSLANATARARAEADSAREAANAARIQAEESRKMKAREDEEARKRNLAASAEEARKQARVGEAEEERKRLEAVAAEEARRSEMAEAGDDEARRRVAARHEAEEQRKRAAAQAAQEEENRRQAALREVEQQREMLKAIQVTGKERGVHNEMSAEVQAKITFEEITENNRVITRATVQKGNRTNVYSKIVYNWGGIFYFKDDQSISESLFKMATRKL